MFGPELSKAIQSDIALFGEKVCGLPVSHHKGQVVWLANSKRTINILRPGNKWGKSLIGGLKHVWHAYTKPLLPKNLTDDEWLKAEYQTLNFGPGYEQARDILRMARDIVQGNVLIPEQFQEEYGHFNDSKLKDWFITDDKADKDQLPYIGFWNNTVLYGRSYSEMGAAFKMKALAFISGDECADIQELWTFTNNTLLPRLSKYNPPMIDYYGTPQPEGFDYMKMIEMAEEDMKGLNYKKEGMYYTQRGTMYENVFLPRGTIDAFVKIMDPTMAKQVIEGDYVETGEKYFGFVRIQNAIDENIQQIDIGEPGRKYVTIADYAGGESVWADNTVIGTIDYTEEPYKLVNIRIFKGGDIPIPMQYNLTEEIVNNFGGRGALIIDSSSLGGKNAMAFLGHLHPISAEFGNNRGGTIKGQMLATLKIAFDGGQSQKFKRTREKDAMGNWKDMNPDWGLIRIPNNPKLIGELQNYKLDDGKIRQDCVMMMAMGIHWIEMRRPKNQPKKATEFDFLL